MIRRNFERWFQFPANVPEAVIAKTVFASSKAVVYFLLNASCLKVPFFPINSFFFLKKFFTVFFSKG